MLAKTADRFIKSGQPIIVRNSRYGEIFIITIARRDRFNLYTTDGGVFDRSELDFVAIAESADSVTVEIDSVVIEVVDYYSGSLCFEDIAAIGISFEDIASIATSEDCSYIRLTKNENEGFYARLYSSNPKKGFVKGFAIEDSSRPEENSATYQVRFFHTSDYANNRSEEYLQNGAFYAEYSSHDKAYQALYALSLTYERDGMIGRFDTDQDGQIVGWQYSSFNFPNDSLWGFRYWIVKVENQSESEETPQSYTLEWYGDSSKRNLILRSIGLSPLFNFGGGIYVSGYMTESEKNLLLQQLEAYEVLPDSVYSNHTSA